jgi:hypothetical protein
VRATHVDGRARFEWLEGVLHDEVGAFVEAQMAEID